MTKFINFILAFTIFIVTGCGVSPNLNNTNGDKGANTAFTISTSAELNNRQMHQREIDWLKANGEKFAKELYGENPTSSQINDATARLAQEGVRNIDLMGRLALGENDWQAMEFIAKNAPQDLFKVANSYEYKDATINLSNLSNDEFANLNNFYKQYLYTTTSQNEQGFDFVSSQWQKYANANLDSAVNNFSFIDTIVGIPEAMKDFVVEIPDKGKSSLTYADSLLPTDTKDRLNILYGEDGARTQANISTMDTIDIISLGLGTAELVNLYKNALKNKPKLDMPDTPNAKATKDGVNNNSNANNNGNNFNNNGNDGIVVAGGSVLNKKSLAKQEEIKELFDKNNNRKGITIADNITYLDDMNNKGGAKIFKNVSDENIFTYFKELSGIDEMPDVKKVNIAGKTSDLYSIKTDVGSFTLRNNSKSQLPNGEKPRWTIDIKLFDDNGVKTYELKFE